MARPVVLLHPFFGMQIMLVASMAMVPNAHVTIHSDASIADATMSQSQRGVMMRREPIQRSSTGEVTNARDDTDIKLGINAAGSQVKLRSENMAADTHSEKHIHQHYSEPTSKEVGKQGESMAELDDASQFGSAAEEQELLGRTQASPIPEMHKTNHKKDADDGPHFSEAALAQESEAASTAEEEKKQDEELYYKLFPEERPGAAEAASLLESSTKSFRIRVPVSGGGKKLCLTEDMADRQVRAEPCRPKEPRQKWYWSGEKIQNMHSTGRCLGVDQRKKPKDKKSEHHVQGHSLSMNFKCSLQHAPLTWALTETGQLRSVYNQQCMAINEMEDFSAMVLPCGYDMRQAE